jgi:2-keto-4-pentenoate hydratase
MAAQPKPHHSAVSPLDHDRMNDAAELMLRARRECNPMRDLPENLRPANLEEAYALQDIVAMAFAPLGGWKIGAPAPDATPLFSAMPLWGGYAHTGQTISHFYRRLRGIEAEIAFCLAHDLPPRRNPYTRDEVVAAIASVHPAIELVESAFADPDKADRFSVIGDLQSNGGLAVGPPCADWRAIDLSQETVAVYVDGEVRFDAPGANSAGPDLLRLLVWLANQGSVRTGGLRRGDWITTGSWSGKTFAMPGQTARVSFTHIGELRIRFE